MTRLPPALAATATARILELLGEPPGSVVEIGFAGIHAAPLRLAGWEVTVVEADPAHRERARQRAGEALPAVPERFFDVAVMPETGISGGRPPGHVRAGRVIVVGRDGSVAERRS